MEMGHGLTYQEKGVLHYDDIYHLTFITSL